MDHTVNDILTFWFGGKSSKEWGIAREIWFKKDENFDAEIRERFGQITEDAAAGKLDGLARDPEGALALVIALDQFPRNIYRASPRAFAADAKAQEQTERALAKGWDAHLVKVQRQFLYLPLMHAEDLDKQTLCVDLWRSKVNPDPDAIKYAIRHREIIERFGRFPHRNEVLGRESTPEEIAFLKEPMSSF